MKEAKSKLAHWFHVYNENGAVEFEDIDLDGSAQSHVFWFF